MLTRRILTIASASLLSVAIATPVMAQDKPLIRYGYILPALSQLAGVFTLKPEILKHYGKTYNYQATFMRASPLLVTAMAAGEIDIGNLGMSTLHQGVVNAGMTDLKVIADEAEDGFNGRFSSQIRVRKDSGINKPADLKGKVIATIALGSGADILTRYTLRKVGLEMNRDFTYLETPFATMKGLLLDKKVDAAYFSQPFATDPEVVEQTKILFTTDDVLGPIMLNVPSARGGFLAKNRAAMVDFLEDWLRVLHYYYDPKNRDEAIKVVSESSKVPEPVLRRYLFTQQDNYRNLDGLPDLAVFTKNWAAMKELGLIKQDININDHADLSLIKEAAARLK